MSFQSSNIVNVTTGSIYGDVLGEGSHFSYEKEHLRLLLWGRTSYDDHGR